MKWCGKEQFLPPGGIELYVGRPANAANTRAVESIPKTNEDRRRSCSRVCPELSSNVKLENS